MDKPAKDLSDIVVYKNYAKYKTWGGTRETYEDVVRRARYFMIKSYPDLEDGISEAFKLVYDKKVVPSMRLMQFSGKPIEFAPNRIYNCGYMAIDEPACFSELMFLLLGGTGLGYGVRKKQVAKLPPISAPIKDKRYMVQDSIVGWSDAVKALMNAYFKGKYRPKFDYRDIRKKGTLLKTSGGRAPGSEPLERSLLAIEQVLQGAMGRQLKTIEVSDICCYIAEAVLAGGIRRAAMIASFDFDDEDMLYSKSGDWTTNNIQRCRANISVCLERTDPDIKAKLASTIEMCKHNGYGEPGVVIVGKESMFTNPCGEIALEDCSFCNLTEVVATEDKDEMRERVWAASFLGTLQAGFTDFFYLREKWRNNCQSNPILGVSITGIAGVEFGSEELDEYKHIVDFTNERVAKKIGIGRASRTTCVKPSGTTSLVLGTSSGVHAYYAPFYERTIEIEGDTALGLYLKEVIPAQFIETSLYNPANYIVKVPIKAPEGARVVEDETIEMNLELLEKLNVYWIGEDRDEDMVSNNVSCTLYMKEEDDWAKVTAFLQEEAAIIGGVSMFPYSDAKYDQPVLKKISEETYREQREMWDASVSLRLDKIHEEQDNTTQVQSLACAGGACEI